MIDFLTNYVHSFWDYSIEYYQWWSSFLDKTWVVIIGTVFCIIGFLIQSVKIQKERAFDFQFWDVICIFLPFMVMFFDDYAPWDRLTGVERFFGWIAVLVFTLVTLMRIIMTLVRFIFGVLGSIYLIVKYRLVSSDESKQEIRKSLLLIGLMWVGFFVIYTGALLMSSFAGPVGLGAFVVAALLMPTNDSYLGRITDYNGRDWDVFRG